MGWDSIFAGLLARWIVERHDQKKKEKARLQQHTHSLSGVSSVSERLFVSSKNKALAVTYKTVCADTIDDLYVDFGITYLDDADLEKLQYYYSRLAINPASYDCRTELIHFLLKKWKDDINFEMVCLLQNELTYLIDYMQPYLPQERMYQHLAMFLSAECYFFKGEFAKALKRLYQVLDWQEIYDNIDDQSGIDFNGLYYFHEATVSNIINLYALAGLPDKADEVRNACRKLVSDACESYHSLMGTNSSDANIRVFLQGKYDMIMATNGLQGYYLISDVAYTNNLFKESITTYIRGQAIYAIETQPYDHNSFSVVEGQRVVDGEIIVCNSLHLNGYGEITNYEAALDRDREEMRRI
ncbi:MAG: hypothetical protein IJC90_03610 [Clostridia bacterium]|nr:hypothetical protein [Clostridia bacterium]